MNKKAIAILGAIFLLIVGTLGFLIYAKYGKKSTTTTANLIATTSPVAITPITPVTPDPTSLTPSSTTDSAFVKLSIVPVLSPTLFFDGTGVAFFTPDGQLNQANLINGVATQLDRQRSLQIKTKANISRILWPRRGDDFIAEFNNGGKKSWSYFSSKVGDYTDLPAQVVSVDWMPTGEKILYVWLENGKATLNISNPDTTNWKQISEMWENDNAIQISPDGLNIAYYETTNGNMVNPINITSPDGKTWNSLVKDGYNYGVLWSPDSQKILFAKKEPNTLKYQLWYYNILSNETRNLGLFTTVNKAVWAKDSKTIYAAVPVTGSAGQDSLTTDQFWKMDLMTLDKKQYAAPQTSTDGRDLFLNLGGDKLFFKNGQDGLLYYLDLNK